MKGQLKFDDYNNFLEVIQFENKINCLKNNTEVSQTTS